MFTLQIKSIIIRNIKIFYSNNDKIKPNLKEPDFKLSYFKE